MKERASVGSAIFDISNYAFMGACLLITLYPFYYILIGSLSPLEEVISGRLLFWPKAFVTTAYTAALSNELIPRAYLNTLFITSVGTAFSMAFTIAGSYVLSKRTLPGRTALTLFVVITMLFKGGLIPFYLTVRALGLIDTLWALIFPVMITPFNTIVMRNFFMALPDSLEESALMDGASQLSILTRIVLPLSLPVLATITLFYAVGYWNMFFYAIIFINSTDKLPVQAILREILTRGRMQELLVEEVVAIPLETTKMALIIITILPILTVYPILQRYFVKGLLIGSVKG